MTSTVWMLADHLEAVPSRPDPMVAASLAAWWDYPVSLGCGHVDLFGGEWHVLHPAPSILCRSCALSLADKMQSCIYCAEDVDPEMDVVLVYETRRVTVMFAAHVECRGKVA